jgi:hypothetical protein
MAAFLSLDDTTPASGLVHSTAGCTASGGPEVGSSPRLAHTCQGPGQRKQWADEQAPRDEWAARLRAARAVLGDDL